MFQEKTDSFNLLVVSVTLPLFGQYLNVILLAENIVFQLEKGDEEYTSVVHLWFFTFVKTRNFITYCIKTLHIVKVKDSCILIF